MLLVTGGAGYIGSHTVLELLSAGYEVVVLDNLANSKLDALHRVQSICGRACEFVEGDLRDSSVLSDIFSRYDIDTVLHFSGLKAVGESARFPFSYYDNNVCGTLTLCKAMARAGVFRLVFSSSATVYGDPSQIPITESHQVGFPNSPYGRSKLMAEQVLNDLAAADSRWSVAILRYFNPVGAHVSGLIGEDPKGIPNNLLPYISQVAVGRLKELSIFGNDYPTVDGTGVRDYIHVVDLAKGHLAALSYISKLPGVNIWNLGTGVGYSVLEMLVAFECESGRSISYKFLPRRTGDIAECWSDPTKAYLELAWRTELGLQDMIADTWRWQLNNPNGY